MKKKQKRDLVLKTDPETKEQYWAHDVITVYKPEAVDRERAVLDILGGKCTPEDILKQYDLN